MVIIIPRPPKKVIETIVKGYVYFIIVLLSLISPIIFMGGIGELIFGDSGIFTGIAMTIGGFFGCLIIVGLIIDQEEKSKKKNDRFLTMSNLILLSLMSFFFISSGLALPYDGTIENLRFALIGGGLLILIPCVIIASRYKRQQKDGLIQDSDKNTGEMYTNHQIKKHLIKDIEQAYPIIESIIKKGSKKSKDNVLFELRLIQDTRYVPILLTLLKSEFPDQRIKAAEIIASLGDINIIDDLELYLKDERDFGVKRSILTAIDEIKKQY